MLNCQLSLRNSIEIISVPINLSIRQRGISRSPRIDCAYLPILRVVRPALEVQANPFHQCCLVIQALHAHLDRLFLPLMESFQLDPGHLEDLLHPGRQNDKILNLLHLLI